LNQRVAVLYGLIITSYMSKIMYLNEKEMKFIEKLSNV